MTTAVMSAICLGQVTEDLSKKLWLPTSQKQYMPNLFKAAELVQQQERCLSLVRGEYMSSHSSPGRPVFRVICRNENNLTFPILIDGISYDELHVTGETRLQQRQRHLPQYSRICLTQLKIKANRMVNPHWPEGVVLEPVLLNDDAIHFEVDFTAESLRGVELEYRGYCYFSSLQQYSVDIRPIVGSK